MSLLGNIEQDVEVEGSPEDTPSCGGDEAFLVEPKPAVLDRRIWKPPVTPEATTPSTSARPSAGSAPPPKKARRARNSTALLLRDSRSDANDDSDEHDEKGRYTVYTHSNAKSGRDMVWVQNKGTSKSMEKGMDVVMGDERVSEEAMEEVRRVDAAGDGLTNDISEDPIAVPTNDVSEDIITVPTNDISEDLIVVTTNDTSEGITVGALKILGEVLAQDNILTTGDGKGLENPTLAQAYEGLNTFTWSDDYSTFSGQEETYLRNPGPMVQSQDPVDIFCHMWNTDIMSTIAKESNNYAWNMIAPLTEVENRMPKYLAEWTDTSVEELYRYLAINMLMTFCHRTRLKDYWTTNVLGMPDFRPLMSKNRYELLTKFLHFVDNGDLNIGWSSYDKNIYKIRPILDHLNKKFAELYIPNKHLSLDESLLLWKGRLSWVQCIRSKAARFGIKSFDLCEAETGYQLRCLLYAGKDSTMCEEPIHGFDTCRAKIVLEVMDGFLDVGHTLVMDNWYNQLPLTRFLKRRKTDVIGTISPRHIHLPRDIKYAAETITAKGNQIARHCGDISIIAWQDVRLVTAVSTYHRDRQIRVGKENVWKPEVILAYNKYMGGVDSKDQKLSMYLLERKRGKKWYMKVFKRLLNTSLLNAYIIYSKNPTTKTLTHRDFRIEVALGLLKKFRLSGPRPAPSSSVSEAVLGKNPRRLMKADHFVEHTEKLPGNKRHKQMRCVRCTAAGRRSVVTLMCSFCRVPLCAGPCWAEYHTLKNLR